jgi:hypothetical protein
MSGDFTSDSIEELAARYWSNIPPPPPPPPSTDIKHFFSKHDKGRSHTDMTVSDTTSDATSDDIAASNAAEIAATSLVQVMKGKGFKWKGQEAFGDELQSLKWWLSPFREPEAGENTHSEVLYCTLFLYVHIYIYSYS